MPRYRNSLNWARERKGEPRITRRAFLALLGFGAVLGLGHMLAVTLGRFLYPSPLKIPPSVFSLGRPKEVLAIEGKVFLPAQKAFIHVASGKVRVQTAICTHLGCTVNSVETGYNCPCHGSTYDLEGKNTRGPATRPLVFFRVFKGASGDLLCDTSRKIHDPEESWWSPVV